MLKSGFVSDMSLKVFLCENEEHWFYANSKPEVFLKGLRNRMSIAFEKLQHILLLKETMNLNERGFFINDKSVFFDKIEGI